MKRIAIFVLAAIMLMGLALSAQANQTINTPWAPDTGNASELNLYTIISGWTGLAVTNAQLQSATVLETLPAGPYTLLNYAGYSAFSQTLEVPSGILETVAASANVNQAVNVPFSEANTFGFSDNANGGTLPLTTQNQNGLGNQSNGFIIPLAQFGGLAGQYIVAFEDGAGTPYGDSDYNDMVGRVSTVPVPPSALLMVSGLFGIGLLGWRRRLFGQA
jgi:hypothetical protein